MLLMQQGRQATPKAAGADSSDRTQDEAFGFNVSAMRAAREMTQREFAERLRDVGVTVDASAVSRIESGARSVRLWEAMAIAEVLGVSLSFLVGGSETPRQEFQELRGDINETMRQAREVMGSLGNALCIAVELIERNPEVLQALPSEWAADDLKSYFASMVDRVDEFEPKWDTDHEEHLPLVMPVLEAVARSSFGLMKPE